MWMDKRKWRFMMSNKLVNFGAAAAMAMSSLSVVLNALLLRGFRA